MPDRIVKPSRRTLLKGLVSGTGLALTGAGLADALAALRQV